MVLWNIPYLTKDFYLCLGGMHFIMSYIVNSCCELTEGLEAICNKDQQENKT